MNRFQSDFAFAGTHVTKPVCVACERNMNDTTSPLLYYWDDEFGTPELSMSRGHSCFWGSMRLMVNSDGRTVLEALGLPFDFLPTQEVRTELVGEELIVENLPRTGNEFFWARPTNVADADSDRSDNDVCGQCRKFTRQPRQLTRLKVPQSDATSEGVFTVRQNHGEPMFVAQDTKALLSQSNLVGIGFYPAGMII